MVRRIGMRWAVLVAVVLALAIPRAAWAQDSPAMAATALLSPGYTVTYTQVVDLGGDGQREAIFKADSPPTDRGLPAQVVGVLTQMGGEWISVYQSEPYRDGSGTIADIYTYPKTDSHPGYVIVNQHQCGANCNSGTAQLLRYDGGAFSTVLTRANDRGTLSADPTSGEVTLRGPVYAYADARCCPEYAYTRTWMWQGNDLTGGNLTFAAAPDKTLPTWFTNDGATLVLGLNGLVQSTPGGVIDASVIAPLLAPMVTITDAANQGCTASSGAVASALVQGLSTGDSEVWPTADGYNVALRWDARAVPTGAMAEACVLDAGQGGGYILHLSRTGDTFVGDALAATPQISQLIPATAVVIPPA